MSDQKELSAAALAFRQLWRGFGSGVALIGTEENGERAAMVATAVISVSMEPPSLLISVNRTASAYGALNRRKGFSLGILSGHNAEIGTAIARAPTSERFASGHWHSLDAPGTPEDGLPWLEEAQATLFCVVDGEFDYGTHHLFIGKVVRALGSGAATANPLLYCDGRFGRFMEMSA